MATKIEQSEGMSQEMTAFDQEMTAFDQEMTALLEKHGHRYGFLVHPVTTADGKEALNYKLIGEDALGCLKLMWEVLQHPERLAQHVQEALAGISPEGMSPEQTQQLLAAMAGRHAAQA